MNNSNNYLTQFKNNTFVIKIGGEVLQSSKILRGILLNIRNLLRNNVRIILVHGGGPQADLLAKQLGHQPVKINGRRVTSAADVDIIKMLYAGSLNIDILSILKPLGVEGIRVSGLDGGLLNVKLKNKKKIDFGFVGEITKVQPKIINLLLTAGYLPVVSPLAATANGTIVNVNADTIATELAIALQADKLILCTNIDGIYSGDKLLSTLTVTQAKQLLHNGVVHSGMAVKLENCVRAIQGGVTRVHIINGLAKQSLLKEVLTKQGVGTMVVNKHEHQSYVNE